MSAASVAARGRRAAEALMVDACTIKYLASLGAQSESTGAEDPIYANRVTGQACKIQARNLSAARADAGGHTAVTVAVTLHLPLSAVLVEPADLVTVTASQDPQLVGRTFRVIAPTGKTFATARRFDVEEVVA